MSIVKPIGVVVENHVLASEFLHRDVILDCYFTGKVKNAENISLLIINDGQDLRTMKFEEIFNSMLSDNLIKPILCVGVHCSKDRKNEYGTAKILDYKGRGAKAGLYTSFIMEELLPFIRNHYHINSFAEKAIAGFSLGGLMALDIAWNNPYEFTRAGVFSGSLWWRDMDQDDEDFDENVNRIMHKQVKEGGFFPWMKFFFEVGTMDETADRNKNGIIDSIDDTLSLIEELHEKGYDKHKDIFYLELNDGRHDVATWARSFPFFLQWGWGVG